MKTTKKNTNENKNNFTLTDGARFTMTSHGKEKACHVEVINGCPFLLGLNSFDKVFELVAPILRKVEAGEDLTAADRLILIMNYNAAYHTSGKIEGITSFDSSCTGCAFCQKMRKAAENNPAHICGYCYDAAQELWKHEARNRHMLNLLIMSAVEYTPEELRLIPVGVLDRGNSSGDTPNETYAVNILNLARINAPLHFAYWAKNTAAVVAACDKVGKPENIKLVQSSPIIGKPAKRAKYFDTVFTVYPDEETTRAAIAAGAWECNGRKCRECGNACYTGAAGENVAEVLRGVNKATRAAIIEYLKTITE